MEKDIADLNKKLEERKTARGVMIKSGELHKKAHSAAGKAKIAHTKAVAARVAASKLHAASVSKWEAGVNKRAAARAAAIKAHKAVAKHA